ncbi:16S rRNA (cytidine(1402)-2'-O)-methyltransferase [Marinobacter salinexigens]|uniref:Ribosomal RNA small subunit methyltransferase I n=1 Tax=Marinobacter salinexigens TaxID=2919747 RepID=A0A5B0VFE2_9GAMM|nr:16S rRNA (cytidine(1402)-2'-O)-methyltransferase [Marinobacter salinexigens]KAA1173357.1 16S rRNA (cytidine(1402)-2'-O)-methyltransferase [Marinobacter salinexigens]
MVGAGGRARGTLYIVATPIGNLDDLSLRASRVLARADVIAAEDTRHSGRLLQHLGIQKKMIALHDHNERARAGSVLDELDAGRNVALISDAGTPLISDPGYVLVREARRRGLTVSPIPGACAFVSALSAAGLPTDRLLFVGFLPAKRSGRRSALEALCAETATLVFYESPHRIVDTIEDLVEVFGDRRELVLGRELTKTFETFYSGTAQEVLETLVSDPNGSRGEFVVMVHGAAPEDDESEDGLIEVDRLISALIEELPVKKVAKIVAGLTGKPKNELYQRALELKPD